MCKTSWDVLQHNTTLQLDKYPLFLRVEFYFCVLCFLFCFFFLSHALLLVYNFGFVTLNALVNFNFVASLHVLKYNVLCIKRLFSRTFWVCATIWSCGKLSAPDCYTVCCRVHYAEQYETIYRSESRLCVFIVIFMGREKYASVPRIKSLREGYRIQTYRVKRICKSGPSRLVRSLGAVAKLISQTTFDLLWKTT